MKGKSVSKTRFSVLMANYNNDKYVAQAIQSVLNQTFRDWELVVVDDCSTDDSVKVVSKFLGDERVRFFKNKSNIGYIGTLKRLISESRAEVLGILDSDDVLVREAIEIMDGVHGENPDCGFIYSQYEICDASLKHIGIGGCRAMVPGETNLRGNWASHFKTFKKRSYFKTGGFDEEILYAEDRDLVFKMEEVTDLLFVDKVLYKYRVLSGSQGNDPVKKQVGNVSHILAKFKAYRRRLHTDVPSLARKEMAGQLWRAARMCVKQEKWEQAGSFAFKLIRVVGGWV
jgi:glycosyltransferase involved in cell wall biosynthesis